MFSARLQLLVFLVSGLLLGCGEDAQPIAYEQVWLGPLQGDEHRDADAGEAPDAGAVQEDDTALDAGEDEAEDAGEGSSDAGEEEGEDSAALPEPEQLQQQLDAGAPTTDAGASDDSQ